MKDYSNEYNKLPCKRKTRKRMWFIFGLLIGITLFNLGAVLFEQVSHRIATKTYKWYRTPHECLKSTTEIWDMVDLAARATKALERLNIPAPVCYGTLWGVLRYEDILPWDNNVDFCVMNEYLDNVSFAVLQKTFAEEGVILYDFDYRHGSYNLRRGLAEGYINVFANCTDLVPIFYPELTVRHLPGEESAHWACAYSVSSLLGQYTHDFNRPFPTWLLTPPFTQHKLADIKVYIPHDHYELQKHLYPDDWWLEVKPLGCL